PASFCGVWGLRTTHGRFSIDRAMPLAPSFDTVGWFARDLGALGAASAAFGIGVGAGAPTDRLLFPVDIWARASAETVAALAQMVARLQTQVAPLTPMLAAPGGLEDWREAFRIHQGREVWRVHGDWVARRNPAFGAGIAARFAMAKGITDDEFAWAEAQRKEISDSLLAQLGESAVIVLPTSPGPAPLRASDQATQDDFRARALEMLCLAGHAGLPQLSMPAGTADGGPVGLSIMGPRGGEELLLATAAAIA
ncbi:MAG: amidase family protein, partial [Pseudomonadota bacterium]